MLAAGLGKRSLTDMFAFIQYYSWDEERAIETIAAAIELGGDVNAANEFGETALHGATYHSATKVMQFLSRQGREHQRHQLGRPDAAARRRRAICTAAPSSGIRKPRRCSSILAPTQRPARN